MEYCSGGDLRSHLRAVSARNHLSEETIWFWFVQLSLALHHMHSHKVLHRDIKTANVFLSNEGFLVLGDLGIARELGTEASGDALAVTVIGTPLYMAPEMFEGKAYTFSSDIWALGCVLYELCVGSPPFTGTSTPHLMRQICSGKYAPIPATFSPQLGRIVNKMLSLQPGHRPTIDGLLRDDGVRIHLERYAFDRLAAGSRSKCCNETERKTLEEQLRRLGVHAGKSNACLQKPSAPIPNTPRFEVERSPKEHVGSKNDQHERELIAIREQARQEQLLLAMKKLQDMRFQQGDESPKPLNADDPVTDKGGDCDKNDINLPDIRRLGVNCEVEWKAPVVAERPLSGIGRGRKSSSPSRGDVAFLGIPRLGVPLTAKAKVFAAKSHVCRDVRELRKVEAAKAARRYQQGLDVRQAPKQRAVSSKPESMVMVSDKETDEAILAAMAELQRFI